MGLSKEREAYVVDNMNLVYHLAHTYIRPSKDEYNDCIQEGFYGLCLAAERFNPDLDIKFSTFAATYIIGYMKRFKRSNSVLKEPRKIKDLRYKILSYESKNPDCSIDKVCSALDITTSLYREVVNAGNLIYLDSIIENDEGTGSTRYDTIPSTYSIETVTDDMNIIFLKDLKDYVLHSGNYGDKIIAMYNEYFDSVARGDELTQRYLGDKYGISQAHVSRSINSINAKIQIKYRNIMNSD